MPFATLTAEPAVPECEDEPSPGWTLSVDGEPVTSTTMILDHREDPLSVNHHCASDLRCSFVDFVSARRLGDVIIWCAPIPVRRWPATEPRVLWSVERAPLFFTIEAYCAGIASIVRDPAAAVAALSAPLLAEAQEMLWFAAQRAFAPWPEIAPGPGWWEPAWPALLAERTWATTEPRDLALEERLLAAAHGIASARVVEVVPERPAGGCVLYEGFMAREGEPVLERLVATAVAGAEPRIWHPVGRGCWGRLAF